MDRNTLLAFALSMLVFTTWLAWQAERAPKRPTPGEVAGLESQPESGSASVTRRVEPRSGPQREAPQSPPVIPEGLTGQEGSPVSRAAEPAEWSRRYERELYVAEVTNRGAALTDWQLRTYFERTDQGEVPMRLTQLEAPHDLALTMSFEELGLGDLSHAVYEVESEGDDSVVFALTRGDVLIRKTYLFDPDSYEFHLDVELENRGQRILSPRFELAWPAAKNDGNDFTDQSLAALHEGDVERQPIAGIGHPGFFDGLFGDGDRPGYTSLRGEVDWAGIDTKYFVGALMPERTRNAVASFEPVELGSVGRTLLGFMPTELPPGQSARHAFTGYVGPKEPLRLESAGQHLSRSINRGYGWVAPLTRFFEWLLAACHTVIPNYGVAIIVITILVRVVTLPIVSRQMKSMERMRALQPQLKELQEKYKDDRAKQSEEMMKLYKRTGVNPLGGCLPMLLQFPVFIGLFFALQSSIELRHADFFLWINDLSAPEELFTLPGIDLPVRLLPIIMGASMVLQQKLTPMTIDPAQARMMLIMMPAMMTVLFYQFPSGLVLYWMVSNLLGIGHQLYVGRKMRAEA